jgi:hypothetical protein
LIPSGTGGTLKRIKKTAAHRDDLILKERARIAEERAKEAQILAAAAEEAKTSDAA